MTIDEAIAREKRIYEENQKVVDTHIICKDVTLEEFYCDDTEVIEEHLNNYKLSSEYHKQITEWLEELKIYKECNISKTNFLMGYNKAIDDVMKKAKEIQEEQIKNLEQSPMRSGKRWAIYMGTYLGHIQVACKRLIEEQLKEK